MRGLIVDRQALFAEALTRSLRRNGLDVVGFCVDSLSAQELARATSPDFVLIGLTPPEVSGIALGELIRREFPKAILIALAAHDQPGIVKKAMDAGFHGVLSRDASVTGILEACRAFVDGSATVPGSTEAAPVPPLRSRRSREHLLTARELEVLALLAEGKTSDEMRDALGITISTVRSHVEAILSKLNAGSRLEAVAVALRHGIPLSAPPGVGRRAYPRWRRSEHWAGRPNELDVWQAGDGGTRDSMSLDHPEA
jgi:DNA-binding NarL/FixJ family response regulator